MTPPLYPLPGATTISRRSFLIGTASFAAAALLAPRLRGAAASRSPSWPFALGVASGDPLPDGFVLWTRLAPRPRQPGGGMPAEPVKVEWQVAEDETMSRIVQTGEAIADPAWAHSVHVEVSGLRPNRWYWYRFKVGRDLSPVGRTRTMPAPDAVPERLRFAFASCQKYEVGYYTAFEHMVREELDLIVHLGDYIYEKDDAKDGVRPHGLKETFTLDDYRARYSVYKMDPALQAAHAHAPWIVTWDDHEVSNDYANDIHESEAQTRAEFLVRRAAAYQAYYEHMPLRRTSLPVGPDLLLYRRLNYGRLASFHVLDTRQYRTDQPLGSDLKPPSPVLMDPRGTMMGDRQRDWLFQGLDHSTSVWNIIAQQVMVARVDLKPGPGELLAMDKWAGYEFERRRLLRQLRDGQAKNPVVITGDVHCNWANELLADFDRADARPVGVEFVGTSISSGGDTGSDKYRESNRILAENPFVKFFNDERGYVSCEVTPQEWRTFYRTVPFVSRPGAPLQTRATFVVENGRPVLQRA